jgi:hypothetical protein
MGMADFGVGHGGFSYAYNSSEFLANFTWKGLNFHGSGGNPVGDTSFSIQLNVVLEFTDAGSSYSYWIQDVAFLNSTTLGIAFVDNVWNLSASGSCLGSTSVVGNGSVDTASCYYAYQPFIQPGAFRIMPNLGRFSLMVRSYRVGSGPPRVGFEYWDGATTGFVTYDNVAWPWAVLTTSDRNFVVDGSQYTPDGHFYDAEVTLGGPGGGTSVVARDFTDTSICLLYWNGHNFQAPRSAWNFGSNTAETVSNISSIWYGTYTSAADGTPLLVQLNGTAFDAGLDHVYDQSAIGNLDLSAPGFSAGTVAIGSTDWDFTGGSANLTPAPGTYHVWVNSSSTSEDLGDCTIGAGTTTNVVVGTGCTPTTRVPTASPSSIDLGQSTTFETALMSSGSGGDTYTWTVTPSGLGCSVSTTSTFSCTPTKVGSYQVSVTVRDSAGRSMSTQALSFVTYPDPSSTLDFVPVSIDLGQTTTLLANVSDGSGRFTYAWSGLPPGCPNLPQGTLSCVPKGSGTFQVRLTATDSNGMPTEATVALVVLPDPTVMILHISPDRVLQGGDLTIAVNVSGGRGPLRFSYSGLPNGCSSLNTSVLHCSPTGVGTFGVLVVIIDENGMVAYNSTTISVEPAFLGVPALEGYALIVIPLLAAATIGLIVMFHRARGRHPPASRRWPSNGELGQKTTGPATPGGSLTTASAGSYAGATDPVGAVQPFRPDGPEVRGIGLDPGSVPLSTPLIDPPNPVCWHCQYENPPGSRYCAHCALPLVPPPPPGSSA